MYAFNPHTMYNVIKEREEFQEFCKNCKKNDDSVIRFSKNHERKLEILIKCRQSKKSKLAATISTNFGKFEEKTVISVKKELGEF